MAMAMVCIRIIPPLCDKKDKDYKASLLEDWAQTPHI